MYNRFEAVVNLLTDDAVRLPKARDTDDFIGFVDGMFHDFQAAVARLKPHELMSEAINNNASLIENVCEALRSAIRVYYLGRPTGAFQAFESAMDLLEPHLGMLTSTELGKNPDSDTPAYLEHLYRVREADASALSKSDLFHIPFERRHLVSTKRYSIPGLPCLYLGGSLYVCWEELGRPDLNSLQIARFAAAPDAELQVLDFGHPPEVFSPILQNPNMEEDIVVRASEYIAAYITCWPLIAACSIRTRYPNAPFKPEYILPQLLLQHITTKRNLDGVRYFSVRVARFNAAVQATANYVFPAKTFAPNGQCAHLTNRFLMTEPVSWQLLNATRYSPVIRIYKDSIPPHPGFQIEVSRDLRVAYGDSEFGDVERKLKSLPCTPLVG